MVWPVGLKATSWGFVHASSASCRAFTPQSCSPELPPVGFLPAVPWVSALAASRFFLGPAFVLLGPICTSQAGRLLFRQARQRSGGKLSVHRAPTQSTQPRRLSPKPDA